MKSLRVVLVPLFGSGIDAECLDTGLAVAGRFGAHLDGLFVRIDPLDAIPVIGEGVSPAVIDQLTQLLRRKWIARARPRAPRSRRPAARRVSRSPRAPQVPRA